jgi:hypothetical protein
VVVNIAAVVPNEGWGFLERIDGKLAPGFEIDVKETGVDIGNAILGWRGIVTTGKYAGAVIEMTPRHVRWDGCVVANVIRDGALVFSGMAETAGLELDWE